MESNSEEVDQSNLIPDVMVKGGKVGTQCLPNSRPHFSASDGSSQHVIRIQEMRGGRLMYSLIILWYILYTNQIFLKSKNLPTNNN